MSAGHCLEVLLVFFRDYFDYPFHTNTLRLVSGIQYCGLLKSIIVTTQGKKFMAILLYIYLDTVTYEPGKLAAGNAWTLVGPGNMEWGGL